MQKRILNSLTNLRLFTDKEDKISKTAPPSPIHSTANLSTLSGMGVTSSLQPGQFVMNNPDFLPLSNSHKTELNLSENGQMSHHRKSAGEFIANEVDQNFGHNFKNVHQLALTKPNGVFRDKSSRKFQRLFNIAEEEILVKSFNCALVDEILFQGRFYASVNYFCFYAKIANKRKLNCLTYFAKAFGHSIENFRSSSQHHFFIKIGLGDIFSLTKEKTAGIFPNAIGIHTKDNKFMFTSFMSRDTTFRCLAHLIDNFRSQKNQPLHWISGEDQHDSTDDNDSVKIDFPSKHYIRKEDPENSSLDNASLSWDSNKPVSHRLKRSAPIKRKYNSSHSLLKRGADSSSYSLNSAKSISTGDKKISDGTKIFELSKNQTLSLNENSTHPMKINIISRLFFRIYEFLSSKSKLLTPQMCICIAYIVLVLMAIFAIFLAYQVHHFQLEYVKRASYDQEQMFMPQFNYKPLRTHQSRCMFDNTLSVCPLLKQEEALHQKTMEKVHQTVIDSVHLLDNLLTNLRKHSLSVLSKIYAPPQKP